MVSAGPWGSFNWLYQGSGQGNVRSIKCSSPLWIPLRIFCVSRGPTAMSRWGRVKAGAQHNSHAIPTSTAETSMESNYVSLNMIDMCSFDYRGTNIHIIITCWEPNCIYTNLTIETAPLHVCTNTFSYVHLPGGSRCVSASQAVSQPACHSQCIMLERQRDTIPLSATAPPSPAPPLRLFCWLLLSFFSISFVSYWLSLFQCRALPSAPPRASSIAHWKKNFLVFLPYSIRLCFSFISHQISLASYFFWYLDLLNVPYTNTTYPHTTPSIHWIR